MDLILLAEHVIDPAFSGWTGAGLLGMVLAWLLLKHLPAKDKQIMDMLESREKALEAKDIAHDKAMEAKDAIHDKVIKAVTDHCKEELVIITERFQRWIDTLEQRWIDTLEKKA